MRRSCLKALLPLACTAAVLTGCSTLESFYGDEHLGNPPYAGDVTPTVPKAAPEPAKPEQHSDAGTPPRAAIVQVAEATEAQHTDNGGLFDTDDHQPVVPGIRRMDNSNPNYPNLASVPPRPTPPSTPESRTALFNTLNSERLAAPAAAEQLKAESGEPATAAAPKIPDHPPALPPAP